MSIERVVAIGGSAGAVEALLQFIRPLSSGLPASICVVIHQPDRTQTFLPQLLRREGTLPVVLAGEGTALSPGSVYVGPPGAHLIVEDGRLRLMRTARENGHRPAIDPLFRSVARAYGDGAVGVLLSGADDDGTEGLMMIKALGGVALVQDPDEALFARMPQSAIEHVGIDRVLPAAALAPAVEQIVMQTAGGNGAAPMPSASNPERDREEMEQKVRSWREGGPENSSAGLSCPLCGGGIWTGREGALQRFRCETGHEFSQEAFLREQEMMLETTLWHAVRALNERAALLRRLSRLEMRPAQHRSAEEADELEQGLEFLRRLLQHSGSAPSEDQLR